MIRSLSELQTHDPQRGSFVVKPKLSKKGRRPKRYRGLPVYIDAFNMEFVVL